LRVLREIIFLGELALRRQMGGERTEGNGQWAMGDGQWAMGDGRRSQDIGNTLGSGHR
jgi:hypothetical protein